MNLQFTICPKENGTSYTEVQEKEGRKKPALQKTHEGKLAFDVCGIADRMAGNPSDGEIPSRLASRCRCLSATSIRSTLPAL